MDGRAVNRSESSIPGIVLSVLVEPIFDDQPLIESKIRLK